MDYEYNILGLCTFNCHQNTQDNCNTEAVMFLLERRVKLSTVVHLKDEYPGFKNKICIFHNKLKYLNVLTIRTLLCFL